MNICDITVLMDGGFKHVRTLNIYPIRPILIMQILTIILIY